MADINYSNVLDGTTDVTGNGAIYSWSGNFMQVIDFYTGGGLTTQGTFTMSGDWYMHSMYLNGDATYDAIFNDSFDGGDRTIENLRVGGGITADLGNTRIRYINQNDPGDTNITLGSERVTLIELDSGSTHVLNMGTNTLNLYRAYQNDVTVNGNGGRVDGFFAGDGGDVTINVANTRFKYVELFQGNFTINGGTGTEAGRIENLNLYSSDNTKTVIVNANDSDINTMELDRGGTINGGIGANAGDIRYIKINSNTGDSTTITGNDSRFESIRAGDGDEAISLSNGADQMSLGRGTNSVTSTGGFIGSILSFSGDNTVNLSSGADIRTIGFSNGVDVLNIEGRVSVAELGGNDDIANVTNGGRIDMLRLSNGDNILNVDNGIVESVIAYEGDDVLNMSSGRVNHAVLHDGNNTAILTGGEMSFFRSSDGDDTVVLSGDARVDTIYVGDGTNTVRLGSEHTDLVLAYDGSDTVTTGSGNVDAIRTNGGRDIITTGTGYVEVINAGSTGDVITAGGNVGTIRGQDGNDKIYTFGYADLIKGGAGKDIIDTRDGLWVGQIRAGDDNDKVWVGVDGAGQVRLENGNDTVFVQDLSPTNGIRISGGSGEDTLNFSAFTTAVTMSLDLDGAWQSVGAPGGDNEVQVAGYFSETSIENIAGSNFHDVLTGDQNANVLQGRSGNDTLMGLAGDDDLRGGGNADILLGGDGVDALRGDSGGDILNGEAGNDRLYGGGSADTFVFDNDVDAGADKIKDWQDGADVIDLRDHGFAGFADVLAIASNAGSLNMKLDFANGTQLLIENFRLADFDVTDVVLA